MNPLGLWVVPLNTVLRLFAGGLVALAIAAALLVLVERAGPACPAPNPPGVLFR